MLQQKISRCNTKLLSIISKTPNAPNFYIPPKFTRQFSEYCCSFSTGKCSLRGVQREI